MREIKFRAWDAKNKRMILSVGFTNSDVGRCWVREEYMVDDHSNFSSYDNWIPMQYTGLNDKNGKEIYEGDIFKVVYELTGAIKIGNFEINIEEEFGTKNFNIYGAYISNIFDLSLANYNDRGEVLGNIYETPELLK